MGITAFLQAANVARSTLASTIVAGALSVTVQSGHGARFLAPSYATMWNSASSPSPALASDREVVLITAVVGDVLTITRAQRSTVAAGHTAGHDIRMLIDSAYITELQTAVNALEALNVRPDVVRWFDDFAAVSTAAQYGLRSDLAWTIAVGGNGAVVPQAVNAANRLGLVSLNVRGIDATFSIIHRGLETVRLGDAAITLEAAIYIPVIADGTNDFGVRFGLGDVASNAEHTDGVYFEYVRATSVNWRICAASNGTRTKTSSATAVAAATWIRLKIVINAAGTSAEFFVDGTSVGTVATNLPTGAGRETGVMISTQYVGSGSTTRYMYVDWFDGRFTFTTAR